VFVGVCDCGFCSGWVVCVGVGLGVVVGLCAGVFVCVGVVCVGVGVWEFVSGWL